MWYRLTVRSNTSNRILTFFDITDATQAWNVACTLMQSPHWANRYVVCEYSMGGIWFSLAPPGDTINFPITETEVSADSEFEESAESGVYSPVSNASDL